MLTDIQLLNQDTEGEKVINRDINTKHVMYMSVMKLPVLASKLRKRTVVRIYLQSDRLL